MLRDNEYYFKIVFIGGGYDQWRFGLPFLLKYRLIFNQDTKQIGFYDDNIKVEPNVQNNSIFKKVWFWILLIIISAVIIISTFFISKQCLGNKRKQKANELDDGFDYEEHKKENDNDNRNNDNERKNKLFENEDNN